MKVRIAEKNDVKDLTHLDLLMAEDEKLIHPEINLENKDINYYKKNITNDFKDKNKVYFIIEENSSPIGFIFGYIKIFPKGEVTQDNICGYISKIFIKKEFRGKGYSKELVKSLLNDFKTKNVSLVFATGVSVKNKDSIKLWEGLDFELYDLSYRKRVV